MVDKTDKMYDRTLMLRCDDTVDAEELETILEFVQRGTPDGIHVVAIPDEIKPIDMDELEWFVDSLRDIVESKKENATRSE